jgi:hypothetical protein
LIHASCICVPYMPCLFECFKLHACKLLHETRRSSLFLSMLINNNGLNRGSVQAFFIRSAGPQGSCTQASRLQLRTATCPVRNPARPGPDRGLRDPAAQRSQHRRPAADGPAVSLFTQFRLLLAGCSLQCFQFTASQL